MAFTPGYKKYRWGASQPPQKGVVRQPQAPAAPAAAPTPIQQAQAASNPLFEAQYNAETGNNNTAYQHNMSYLGQQGLELGNDYGFKVGVGDNGAIDWSGAFTVDPSNPFSKMAMLSRAYQQQQAGTTNNYASQGQLYSSALTSQRSEDQFQNDYNINQTQNDFRKAIQALRYGQTQAGDTLASANTTAAGNRLNLYLGQG